MLSDDELRQALRRAFDFGQRYWQQADSESYAENRRSDETLLKFKAFTEETVTALGVREVDGQTFCTPDADAGKPTPGGESS